MLSTRDEVENLTKKVMGLKMVSLKHYFCMDITQPFLSCCKIPFALIPTFICSDSKPEIRNPCYEFLFIYPFFL